MDCVITSPPYWQLKRYGDEVEGEIGHGQPLDVYLADLRTVFAECADVTHEEGVMWLVVDTLRYPARTERESELLPLPTVLAELAQEVGWRFHDVVVWRKNKTIPYSGERKLRNLVEYVVLLSKARAFKHRPYRLAERHQPTAEWLAGWPERYHPLGRKPANVWDIDIPTQGIWAHSEHLHFCPLPAELVRRCIDLTTDPGDVVFDPFAGIGTVPAQAEAMERVGVGIELNPRFVSIFEEKTRPQFLAAWEEGARERQLRRADQAAEAALIFKLRALKAGRELHRLLERTAQMRPSGHVASEVDCVIVDLSADPAAYVDVLEGELRAVPVQLFAVSNVDAAARQELATLVGDALETTDFKTFGLDLSFEVIPDSIVDDELFLRLQDRTAVLYEFGVSRHGAFTQRPAIGLFPTLPRLLTTFDLGPPLHPTALNPLEQARAGGEKKLIQSLLASGLTFEAVAEQLRLPLLELDRLLRRHGLAPTPAAFAISLPFELPDSVA